VKIEVSPAPDGVAIVRNLFVLYAHDMSAFVSLDVGDDGAFAIPASVASYWSGPDASERFPFLVRADGKLAGFALVRRIVVNPDTYDMGEFFILRKYRRSGIVAGRGARCSTASAGAWEVRNSRRTPPREHSGAGSSVTTHARPSPSVRSSSRPTGGSSSQRFRTGHDRPDRIARFQVR
jgi:predicted acetyltransferase